MLLRKKLISITFNEDDAEIAPGVLERIATACHAVKYSRYAIIRAEITYNNNCPEAAVDMNTLLINGKFARKMLDNDRAFESVIIHELKHLKRGFKMFLFTGLTEIIGRSVLFCGVVANNVSLALQGVADVSPPDINIHLKIMLKTLTTACLCLYSRREEFICDNQAVNSGYGADLAGFLKELSVPVVTCHKDLKEKLEGGQDDYMELLYEAETRASWLERVLSTHPPISERIKRLENDISNQR